MNNISHRHKIHEHLFPKIDFGADNLSLAHNISSSTISLEQKASSVRFPRSLRKRPTSAAPCCCCCSVAQLFVLCYRKCYLSAFARALTCSHSQTARLPNQALGSQDPSAPQDPKPLSCQLIKLPRPCSVGTCLHLLLWCLA